MNIDVNAVHQLPRLSQVTCGISKKGLANNSDLMSCGVFNFLQQLLTRHHMQCRMMLSIVVIIVVDR